jgi:hypothetical protein
LTRLPAKRYQINLLNLLNRVQIFFHQQIRLPILTQNKIVAATNLKTVGAAEHDLKDFKNWQDYLQSGIKLIFQIS